jgi:hypothetical protein
MFRVCACSKLLTILNQIRAGDNCTARSLAEKQVPVIVSPSQTTGRTLIFFFPPHGQEPITMTPAAMTDSSQRIGAICVGRSPSIDPSENGATTILAVDQANAADALSAIDVIAEAFLNDPTWSWAFSDPATRRQWWKFCINEALRYPWTFKTNGFEAVSVWIPPCGTEFSNDGEQSIPRRLKDLAGARASEVTELLHSFDQAHPRNEPHYYLSLLGTRDAHRGRGLGMALLEENLARIDAEHMPAYLESSNLGNNHRYEAVGFVPVVSFRAPGAGPVVTGMWRKSR